MQSTDLLDEKFINCCFTLAPEDIYELDQVDNGPINNVIAGIAKQVYGTHLSDDRHGLTVKMFYVNGVSELSGDIIVLEIRDKDYYQLLLRFCDLLANRYTEVDTLGAFNTFQTKLRGFLEKSGFSTVSSLELQRFKGQDAVMVNFASRGIIKVDFIDPTEFYRDFFDNISDTPVEKGKEYVYLMVNTDTGLIKIGKSIDPVYRERTLHSKEPTVHLIALWSCDQQIEKELHKKFHQKRVRGEWFRLTIPDLVMLEKIMINKVSPE